MNSTALAKFPTSHKGGVGVLLPDCLVRDPCAYPDSEMAAVA